MGGFWLRNVNVPPTGYVGLVVHNAEYEVLTEADLRETRSIGCGGWTEGLPKVRRVEHATLKVAEDDTFYPQALGFTEGREVSVYLKRGERNEYDFLDRAIVQQVRRMVNQQKAVRVEIVLKHGRYIRGQTVPGLARESQPEPVPSSSGSGGTGVSPYDTPEAPE
jgi:hypothetical protein